MAQTILYYPQINIQDGAWLRNAILYWDEVSSIVPYRYYNDLSPELLYLNNIGVYNAVYPEDLFFSDFENEFCEAVIRRIRFYERQEYHSRSGIHGVVSPTLYRNNRIQNGIRNDNTYERFFHESIHYNKLPYTLYEFLNDKGYLYGHSKDNWLEIDGQIAQIYMRTLAEYSIKCSDKDIVLGTDTTTTRREIYRYTRNKNVNTQCYQIDIVNCLPQPVPDTSFEDILYFKDRRKDELNEFRKKIRDFEQKVNHAQSSEEIKAREQEFIESWEHCSNAYYRVARESKIRFFLSSLCTLVALPFVGSLLSHDPDSIQLGAALLKTRLEHIDYRNRINPRTVDGGFSYIIKANRAGMIEL